MLAHELLRSARLAAGLTQAQLAERAGVAQSVISVYESGRRQPALSTLTALIEAADQKLDIQLRPMSAEFRQLSGPRGRVLRRQRDAALSRARAHRVTLRGVFGSVARGSEGDDSDIDLLVDIEPGVGLFALGRLRSELESLLGAAVDLVPEADLKPDVREAVLADLVAL
ncbi:MAG TPA: helix-turn-helix domain-containing protein [Jatrophihabitans sp.]|uniref:helix-turn-helix domain-containing protein n=1 Tax=Jatrophihabitans sp. TaxID=1932789 RepID=UPI002F25C228